MVVIVLRGAQRGAEQEVANPGLDEGEGGAVRVTSSHEDLQGHKKCQGTAALSGCVGMFY